MGILLMRLGFGNELLKYDDKVKSGEQRGPAADLLLPPLQAGCFIFFNMSSEIQNLFMVLLLAAHLYFDHV